MPTANPRHPDFPIPGGPVRRAKSWRAEGLLRLMENVRQAIREDRLTDFRNEFFSKYDMTKNF